MRRVDCTKPLGMQILGESGVLSVDLMHVILTIDRYVKGSFRNRWSLVAWIDWCSGRPIPGDSPSKFKPEGFTTSYDEIGPPGFSGKGLVEREKEMISLKSSFGKGGGCPMAFGRA